MNKATTDVLIVGAGPTGLTLACELAVRGVSFRIIDAAPGPQPGSRGKGLQPRTLELFDRMGIVGRVLAGGSLDLPVRSVGVDGAETLSAPAPPSTPDAPYAASLITPQWRVEGVLRSRLEELGGAVEFATTLSDIEQQGDAVRAAVDDGAGARTLTVRYLIGCDGGRSTVRRRAGIAFLGETLDDVRMIVADVEVDGLDARQWHMWRSEAGFLALCPLPSTDSHQLQASIAPEQEPLLTVDALQELVGERTGCNDIRLSGPSWASLWRCNVRMVDRYRNGRVFLAGDAAHVHSPAGGQGMNTGIQDAFNIGWKLAAVLLGGHPALLDTYEEERLPVAASVLALSNELLRQAIEERGIVFERSSRTQQLGIGYRGASLSVDDGIGDVPVRAGDRAPDAPSLARGGERVRLFDLMRGTHITVLTFDASPAISSKCDLDRFGEQVRLVPIVSTAAALPDRWLDGDGHAGRAYAAGPGAVFVVRPDGYVGLRGTAERWSAVVSYLDRLVSTGDDADDPA